MAESSLSLQYSDLEALVSRYLGYGESPTGTALTDVRRCINGGARLVYDAHDWSFLYCSTTLTTGTEKAFTATVAGSLITSTAHGYTDGTEVRVRSSGGTLPSGLSSTTTYYIISSATNTFQLSTSSGGSAVAFTTVGSGTLYVREYGWLYDLPANFGRICSNLHFAAGSAYPEVQNIGLDRILEMRNTTDLTQRPQYYAIRPKAVDQTTGQRFQICMYPAPDASYVLSYYYRINPESTLYVVSVTNRLYPLGGEVHSELFLEASLAWAERFFQDTADGAHQAAFKERLAISIARDAEMAPKYLGYNADPGMGPGFPFTISPFRTDRVCTYS